MNLFDLLPSYYYDNETMAKVQELISFQTEFLEAERGHTIDERFVETASKMLSRHEKIYGLTVDLQKSDQYRRERIKAKIEGAGTTTKQMIKDVARNFSNGEVEIIEDSPGYKFKIRFTGSIGVPGNMEDWILTLEEIKPAHLVMEFEYIYNVYGDLRPYTYEQLRQLSFEQIRNEVIAIGS